MSLARCVGFKAGLPPPLRLLLAVELAAPHASGADL